MSQYISVISLKMSSSLKDLITHIRACKTAAEERALVAKECAAVRESFKVCY